MGARKEPNVCEIKAVAHPAGRWGSTRMNFIRRWRHKSERDQEQLLVRLWTINSINAEDYGRPGSKLTFDATRELRPTLKYLSAPEIERTVTEAASELEVIAHLRRHMKHGRSDD